MEDRRDIYEIFMTDRWAVQKNIAENGRLFCKMIFVACLVAFLARHDATFARLALLAALPVGGSCLVDQMRPGIAQISATLCCYVLAVAVALAFFILI